MEYSLSARNEARVLTLSGRLDSESAPGLEAWFLEKDSDDVTFYIIDMAGLEYITSAGMRSVLKFWKLMDGRKGRLAFVSMNSQVMEVFRLSGMTALMAIYNSVEDAVSTTSASALHPPET